MEVEGKLKELNMTVDEIEKFTKAFQDEKFRGMLLDYTRELSDPENKKKYEEEITLLERERGNNLVFIHPKPFKVLRTSLNGKQKCFINICTNEKVSKPDFNWKTSGDGRRGQYWSLPHSLHPGRQDRDPKGNKFMIYDVIFHPDTLHIASSNKKFMDMVDTTAIQGIQDSFNVVLDRNNVRELSMKYKGTPQPCVIRKPIPGYKAKEPPAQPDPLAFPYPYENRPSTTTTKPTKSSKTKDSGDSKPKIFQIEPQKPNEPTIPNYTLKYRSFIDLQDFRCSRDSAQSPRPKEIVVTVDMPLLKSARDASLEVKGKTLLLETEKPAYRLEIPLAYSVDEDKGEAKFNKQNGQLTVILCVLPSNETLDFAMGLTQTVSDSEIEQEGASEALWEGTRNEQMREGKKREEDKECGVEKEENWKEQKREGEKSVKEDSVVEKEKCKQQKRKGKKSEEEEEECEVEEEKWKTQTIECEKSEEEREKTKESDDERSDRAPQTGDPGVKGFQADAAVQGIGQSTEENSSEPDDNSSVASPYTKDQPTSTLENNKLAEQSSGIGEEGGASSEHCFMSRTQMKTSEVSEETGMTAESEEYINGKQNKGNLLKSARPTEEVAVGPEKVAEEEIDEDDLLTEQTFLLPGHNGKAPPALLRETDEHGKETVISDHSTSAGFTFQNSLLYELD